MPSEGKIFIAKYLAFKRVYDQILGKNKFWRNKCKKKKKQQNIKSKKRSTCEK
jgi:hypothetical protein